MQDDRSRFLGSATTRKPRGSKSWVWGWKERQTLASGWGQGTTICTCIPKTEKWACLTGEMGRPLEWTQIAPCHHGEAAERQGFHWSDKTKQQGKWGNRAVELKKTGARKCTEREGETSRERSQEGRWLWTWSGKEPPHGVSSQAHKWAEIPAHTDQRWDESPGHEDQRWAACKQPDHQGRHGGAARMPGGLQGRWPSCTHCNASC